MVGRVDQEVWSVLADSAGIGLVESAMFVIAHVRVARIGYVKIGRRSRDAPAEAGHRRADRAGP